MIQPTKCAHGSCTCPAEEDQPYCSDYCSAAVNEGTSDSKSAATTEAGCDCGHSDCG